MTLSVEYDVPSGWTLERCKNEILGLLRYVAQHAANEGLLTGDGELTVDSWWSKQVILVGQEAPSMKVPSEKRQEYWDHFISRWAVERFGGGGYGVTGPRLRKIRDEVMADDKFWFDIVLRHDAVDLTPEQMRLADSARYDHCLGNFWGMIHEMLFSAANTREGGS